MRIEFSEDVLLAEEDLVVTGLNVAAYTLVGFDYDPVATWALNAPIDADDLTLDLSDGVSDRVSLALDGDWDNPTDVDDDSSHTFPSGDGTAGGSFMFHFRVDPVAGSTVNLDVDRDGTANVLTDVIVIVGYLFGLAGDDLIGGNLIAADATRRTAEEIEPFLAAYLPTVPGAVAASAAGRPPGRPVADLVFDNDGLSPIDRFARWLAAARLGF